MTYAMSTQLEAFDRVRMQTLTSVVVILDGSAKVENVRDALGTNELGAVAVGLGKQSLELAQQRVAQWTTRNAVRDCIEACAAYLEDNVDVELEATLAITAKAFGKLGLPKKLERFAGVVAVDPAARDRVLSVNDARNCLVHRRGIVAAEDCGAGATELVVHLETAQLVEVPKPLPGVVPIGEKFYGVSDVPIDRRFALGQEVHFTVGDLIGAWTVVRKLVLAIDRALFARRATKGTP